jgi:hypothetical protein
VLDTLLTNDPVAVAEVIADTHYGSVETRKTLGRQGIDLVAPAPPASSRRDCSATPTSGSISTPQRSPAQPATP